MVDVSLEKVALIVSAAIIGGERCFIMLAHVLVGLVLWACHGCSFGVVLVFAYVFGQGVHSSLRSTS